MDDETQNYQLEHTVSKLDKHRKIISITTIVVVFLVFSYFLFFSAPKNFPINTVMTIEEGMNLRNVSLKFKNDKVIRSRLLFEALVITYGGEKYIKHSDYLFENKLSVFEVARRVSKGDYRTPPVVVTIPEGFNLPQIADTFSSKLVNFDKDKFLLEADALEGYLFPDTYFFFTENDDEDVLKSMRANFEKKIKSFRIDIASSGKTEKDIIIMASLIEGEAKGEDDRGSISGILWKRLDIGMALQVDVALETYKTRGLPKGPIGNPGLKSIEAAIYPEKSSYLYYLHDKDGGIHYAKNFEEHKRNKFKYLK